VPVPPLILLAPQSQTVLISNSVTFSLVARGSSPLFYQWSLNGSNIASATSPDLALANVQITDAGEYTLSVSNTFGSAFARATLGVLARPVILEHPQSLLVAAGTPISLRAAVRGSPAPVNFSWRRNFFVVTNASVSNMTANVFTSVYTTNAVTNGVYTLVISNLAGLSLGGPSGGFASNAYLTVVVPPTNQAVEAGKSATFTASQRGQYGLRYQWQFNASNLSNATNATLILSNVQPAQAGPYAVLVTLTTNVGTAVFSASNIFAANLQVTLPAPSLSHPQFAPERGFQMLLHGTSNRNYAVDISATLTNWTELSTFTVTNNVHQFNDPTASNAVQRFYRARFVQ
jgi:hypothetical protein